MRRTVGTPLAIALLAGPATWLVQNVLRPAAHAHPTLQWFLGPAPNVVVAICFPFVALGYPFESLADTRRGVVAAALLTVAILVTLATWRPIPGARTYDPLDIAGQRARWTCRRRAGTSVSATSLRASSRCTSVTTHR